MQGNMVELTPRQYALLQRADLWALVERHGSILRAAVREPEHADELAELNAAAQIVHVATPPTPAYEARVRRSLQRILRNRERAERAAATRRS